MQLIENAIEISAQAQRIKNPELQSQRFETVSIIRAEIKARHGRGALFGKDGYGN